MSKIIPLKVDSVRSRVSPEEWAVRVDLAATYRLLARFEWDDLIYTHGSARVPGEGHHFLINPYGLMFQNITASSLVKIDVDGKLVMDTPYDYNPAGFTAHSAVHMGRPDVVCVIHTHTVAGMAVSAQADGLLPIVQKALRFYNRLAYHDYEGLFLDLDERGRLARDLGTKNAMILRNHGLLTCGRTFGEAFTNMHGLERACQAQIAAQSSGAKLIPISPEVAERAARQNEEEDDGTYAREWQGLLHMLDSVDPSYKN